MESSYGFLCLVPIIIVITLAAVTKRTAASLAIGSIIASMIAYKTAFFSHWIDSLYTVLANPTWEWMALVCGLFGSLVGLYQASNCVSSFSDIAYKFASTKKRSLIATFILGIIVFVDEWLSVLIVGHAMRAVTDKHKVPRELLAFVCTATAATVCVALPFSTWSAFFAGQYEINNICAPGEGTAAYIESIPYLFFPLISIVVALLIVFGIIPIWGPMRKAVQRAEAGEVLPPGEVKALVVKEENNGKKQSSALNFIVPLLVLAVVSVVTEEMLFGVMSSIAVCAVMYFAQRLLTFAEFCAAMLEGFKDMVGVIGIVFAAFALRTFNETLGLAPYVMGLVKGNIDPALLPAACFVVLSILIYAAGNFWGMAAISFPVVIPIGMAAGADTNLMASSVVCATTFVATGCFYASEVALTCSATQISNVDYAKTSLPLVGVSWGLSVVAYVIAGYML